MNELLAEIEQCPHCDGYGFISDAAGDTQPCPCQRVYEVRRQMINAEIPARFYGAEIDTFEPRSKRHREIVSSVRAYVDAFTAKDGRGLTLLGVTGSGKTHIALGVLKALIRRGHRGLFLNTADLYERLRVTYGEKARETEVDVLDRVRNVDVLVLDDVGAKTQNEWAGERLYLVLNHRYNWAKPVIVTSNSASMDELTAMIGGRLTSRLFEMNGEPLVFPAVDGRTVAEK